MKVKFLVLQVVMACYLLPMAQPLEVDYEKRDHTPAINQGQIELVVTGGMPTYSVMWNDGTTTMSRYQLPMGNYSATVSDVDGNSVTTSVNIGNLVIWKDINGLELRDKLIKKTIPDSWTNAGMESRNTINVNADGALYVRVKETNHTFAIGLSETNIGLSFEDITYCLKIEEDQLSILENNLMILSGEAIDQGDILSVARVGNSITYYKNGTVLTTSPISSANTELVVDFSHFSMTEAEDYLDWDFYTDFGYQNQTFPSQNYVELSRKLGNEYSETDNGVLRFRVRQTYEVASGTNLNYEIYNIQNNNLMPVSTPLALTYGTNWYELNLVANGSFILGQYYLLKTISNKGEEYYLRFKY